MAAASSPDVSSGRPISAGGPDDRSPDPGLTFRIECDCGAWLTGRRPPETERIVCAACGRPWLVLAQRDWTLQPPAPPRPARPAQASLGRLARGLATAPRRAISRAARHVISASPWLKPSLILLAVAAAVIATLYVEWTTGHREHLAQRVRPGWKRALDCLQQKRLSEARQELEAVLAVLEKLSPPHPDAEAIRELAVQVTLLDQLIPITLEDLAARAYSGDYGSGKLNADYAGKTVLFDCVVATLFDEAGRPAGCKLSYRIFDEEGHEALLDASALRLPGPEVLPPHHRAIFLTRLESMEFVAGQTPQEAARWSIRLGPTAVLVTSVDAIRAAGLEPDPATRELIEQQARLNPGRGDLLPPDLPAVPACRPGAGRPAQAGGPAHGTQER